MIRFAGGAKDSVENRVLTFATFLQRVQVVRLTEGLQNTNSVTIDSICKVILMMSLPITNHVFIFGKKKCESDEVCALELHCQL